MKLYGIMKDIFDDALENWRLNFGYKVDSMTLFVINAVLLILALLIVMWFGMYLWNQGILPAFPGIVAPIQTYDQLFKLIIALMVFF
jgi:hypothetical protein